MKKEYKVFRFEGDDYCMSGYTDPGTLSIPTSFGEGWELHSLAPLACGDVLEVWFRDAP